MGLSFSAYQRSHIYCKEILQWKMWCTRTFSGYATLVSLCKPPKRYKKANHFPRHELNFIGVDTKYWLGQNLSLILALSSSSVPYIHIWFNHLCISTFEEEKVRWEWSGCWRKNLLKLFRRLLSFVLPLNCRHVGYDLNILVIALISVWFGCFINVSMMLSLY